MTPGQALRYARRRAGLTQRDLAERAGVRQPVVARIESGAISPRVDTLERLLRAAGRTLATEPVMGFGVDRSQIRELRRLTPAERLATAVLDVRALARLESVPRRR
ncbi:MAG: helix-turn-helix domain-containing protein [Candidatus Limnocylindria bacterium]